MVAAKHAGKKRARKMKVKKGDNVIVLTGKDKGKKGNVLRVLPKDNKVLVQGVNMAKRHMGAGRGQAPGIVDKELPIHVSNISLVDPKTEKSTRVGYKILEGNRKVRIARRSGEVIDL